MKIIDAHIHLFPFDDARVQQMAARAGHINSLAHLRETYDALGMVHAVIMGNRSLELEYHDYPADMFHYCIGLDSALIQDTEAVQPDYADRIEQHLRRDTCCGVKHG